jgi:hypothetical protein
MQAHAGTCRHMQAHAVTFRHMQAHAGTCRHMQAHAGTNDPPIRLFHWQSTILSFELPFGEFSTSYIWPVPACACVLFFNAFV